MIIKETCSFPIVKFTTIFSIKSVRNRTNFMIERPLKMGIYFLKLRKSTGKTHLLT